MMNALNEGVDLFPYLTPSRAEIVRKRNPPEMIVAEPTTIGEQIYYRK